MIESSSYTTSCNQSLENLDNIQSYVQKNSKLKLDVDKKAFYATLATSLNFICGSSGYANIGSYKGNYQLCLNFDLDENRKNMVGKLNLLPIFKKYGLANFTDWQLQSQNSSLFPLQLATNQSVAFLGMAPNSDYSLAQSILKDTKEYLDNPTLREQTIKSIQIGLQEKANPDQVKKAVANLSLCPDEFSVQNLVYYSPTAIEELGGYCLTSYLGKDKDKDFEGIAVLQENGKWFLHIIPGGGIGTFDKEYFDKLMPTAIQKLTELNIIPDYVANKIGRHLGNITWDNFKEWQGKQNS